MKRAAFSRASNAIRGQRWTPCRRVGVRACTIANKQRFAFSRRLSARSYHPPSFLFNRAPGSAAFLLRKLTPRPFARANESEKTVWPLMDTAERVNITRVNRLIGQPMAEASLSSSMCPLASVSSSFSLAPTSAPSPRPPVVAVYVDAAPLHRGNDIKRTCPRSGRTCRLVSPLPVIINRERVFQRPLRAVSSL